MIKFLKVATAAILALTGAQAMAFGSIFVTEPGADGFNIKTLVFNGSSYDITKLTFDFSGTTTTDGSSLVIDGSPFSTVAPSGGSSGFFGGGSVFGFDFTSFNTFDTFSFSWDPDSAISGSYGATGMDFVGGVVTAVTSNGIYTGTFAQVVGSPDVAAILSPVPEAESYALALAGLGVVGLVASRRARKA